MSSLSVRLAVIALSAGALLAIVLAAIYQDDDKLGDQAVVSGGAAIADASGDADAPAGQVVDEFPTGSPIEAWLPASGEASACSEAVGVDLIPGYGATLVINGTAIAPEEMNVVLDDDGTVTNQVTASRSLGQYTFEPSDGCPNGRWLRPTDNVLRACVYRLSDTTRRCVIEPQHTFDAL
jgi:hypothetical protein